MPLERDAVYHPVNDDWRRCKGACVLGGPTPVVFSYMTNIVQSSTELDRDFVKKVFDVKFDIMTLGAFLRSARYESVERLAYPLMVSDCEDEGVLLQVLLKTINSGYKMGVLRLIWKMESDAVLAFVAVGRLTEIDWSAQEDQELLLYIFTDEKVVVLLAKLPMVRRSAGGALVWEGGQSEVKPKPR